MGLGLSKYYKNLKILKVFSPIKYVFDYFKYRVISEEVLIKFQFRKHYGKWPDIENPKMLSEKIQWLKLNERNSLITQCADKYKAREYVEEIIGSEYLVPLVFQTDNIEEFTEDVLPDYPFVVKSNHDTSGVYIFKDKSNLNFKKLKKDLAERLKKNLSIKFKEWSYKNIKPRVIVEKLLIDKENPNKAEIDDYKIHVFNGKVEFVEIMTGRGSGKVKEHCLDRNFNKQDFIFSFPQSEVPISKPSKWDEMMDLAEKLANPFKYVRVDFYFVNNQIYFGEMTFYPHAGVKMLLQPREYDLILGDKLEL